MNIEKTLILKLLKIDYNYENLDNNLKKYLYKIEQSINEIFQREAEAKELLSNNHLSVNNISEKTGIARQTLYNHKILIEYIILRNSEFKKSDISYNNTEITAKLAECNKQIKAMQERDCIIEELKFELKNLRIKLKDRDEEISRIRQSKLDNKN